MFKFKKLYLVFFCLFILQLQIKACYPYAQPTLVSQAIVGGNLNLQWQSWSNWSPCSYTILLQVSCISKPWIANMDTSGWDFNSNYGVMIMNAPIPTNTFLSLPINTTQDGGELYPQLQVIDLSQLCPGKVYKFRAMEIGDEFMPYTPGVSFAGSYWTPTFTFMVPGVFIPPTVTPVTNPTISCNNSATLNLNLNNACGPLPPTYSWTSGVGLSCTNCANPVANPTVTTVYTVNVVGGALACWSASTTVQVTHQTSNGNVTASVTQAGCSGSVSSVSLTATGSASVPISITWSPTPGSISGNSLVATNLPIGITTITIIDGLGCPITKTVSIQGPPPPISFTVTALSGSYSITCLLPSLNFGATSNYTYGPLSYSWTSPSFTANTSTVTISAPNTITVTAIDPSTGCTGTTVLTVGMNTTQPTNSVSPASQSISCNSSPITFSGTCTNPTVNIQHDWYSPINPLPGGVPIATSNNTISILSGVLSPGVYTLVTTNLVNGCKAFKTVTITSLSAWPTFSINSSTNYSIGCSPLNQTTLSITNAASTQTPPSTCSFTFLPPGFGGTLAVGPYGGNTSTVTTIPGTWTVIVNDNSNSCKTILSVPIIQNTVAPNVAATTTAPSMNQTLTCKYPTLLATGTSSTPNTVINWLEPVAPPLVSTATILIGPGSGPNTSTTSLTYANYTVVATNSLNACQTTSVVIISQNFKPPVSSPTISIGTPTSIYCNASTNPVVLTTGASTTTSGGGPLAFPVPVLWEGPSPQGTTTGVSSYSCYVPGIYSLTIMDNYNGCIKTGTINVLDKTQPPVITNPIATGTLDCATSIAPLSMDITGANTGLKYLFVFYPHGCAFSPTGAITAPGISTSSVTVNKAGKYFYNVTNTLTGCRSTGTFVVVAGGLEADFTPDPITGFAPLSVDFTNISSAVSSGTGASNSGITSVWSFGNGTSQTTTANINTNTTYNSPGSYTVMMISSKGICLDTAYKTIIVDIPSKLEVPNIFTPNGDGSNDVFFLKTANLTAISAIIFDRWGNKVYETNSPTGNIAWDGKNAQGKECSAGVYFYVITATGKDAKEYKTKGNVSLYR